MYIQSTSLQTISDSEKMPPFRIPQSYSTYSEYELYFSGSSTAL